jgi:hypothetical protein
MTDSKEELAARQGGGPEMMCCMEEEVIWGKEELDVRQGGGDDLRQGGVFQFHNLVTADQEVRSIRAMREVRRIKAMREEETEEGRDECVHYNVVIADEGGGAIPIQIKQRGGSSICEHARQRSQDTEGCGLGGGGGAAWGISFLQYDCAE